MTDETVSDEAVLDSLEGDESDTTPQDENQTPKATEESSPSQNALPDAAQEAVNNRISKITAQKYAETQRADAAVKRLKELEEANNSAENQVSSGEPKLEDFDFDESKFNEALVNYRVDQRFERQAQDVSRAKDDNVRRDREDGFNVKQAKYITENPDYDNDIKNLPIFQEETLHAIMSMENGPQMAHYLGKHLDVADEIASASPMMAAIKLGQIAGRLTATTKTTEKTNAPAPVETIKPGNAVIDQEADGVRYE